MTALDDRMKAYEVAGMDQRFMPLLPIVARIDGRSFSKFTKGMYRPFDQRMTEAMIATTKYLVKHTGASMGYTQSDEITLAWYSDSIKSQIWFDGRRYKMVSQLAAQATLAFFNEVLDTMPEYAKRLPTFDARAWQVPTLEEGANAFLWREFDATKNSIQMAAREYFSHKQVKDKNGSELQEMLFQKGINWSNYPASFKRGTYVQRCEKEIPFSAKELALLPPKHKAHANPDMVVLRSVISVLDMPALASITNRVGVIFGGEKPIPA